MNIIKGHWQHFHYPLNCAKLKLQIENTINGNISISNNQLPYIANLVSKAGSMISESEWKSHKAKYGDPYSEFVLYIYLVHTHQWTHTHREHTPRAVGSHLCCGARGAVGGSVPCSRAPQSWYRRWRERCTFTPPADMLATIPRLELATFRLWIWLFTIRSRLPQLALNLHHLLSNGAAFNTQSHSSLINYAILHSLSQMYRLR